MIKSKNFKIILFSVFILLLIPLIAMQFTNEVNWTILDFLAMGILLTITAMLIEFAWRKTANLKFRILFCASILFAMLLIWVHLAVGIF